MYKGSDYNTYKHWHSVQIILRFPVPSERKYNVQFIHYFNIKTLNKYTVVTKTNFTPLEYCVINGNTYILYSIYIHT